MADKPAFIGTPKTWHAQIATANTNSDGTGTIADVVGTPGASGSRVDEVEIAATGTTTAGVIRLFLHNGSAYRLLKEVLVSAVTPSTTAAVWSAIVRFMDANGAYAGLVIPSGWKLAASTHNAETFNLFAKGGDF